MENRKKLLSLQNDCKAKTFLEILQEGKVVFFSEPCDCGSHIRHNNGGNYHKRERLTSLARGMYLHESWNTYEDDLGRRITVDSEKALCIIGACLSNNRYHIEIRPASNCIEPIEKIEELEEPE